MTQPELAQRLADYFTTQGCKIFTAPGEMNICYLEGSNEDGTPNPDAPDRFNDRRIVFDYADGVPRILLNVAATTEPGLSATNSKRAAKNGGVARIAFGQYEAWQMGFHKGNPQHPALRQCAELLVYRDRNKDGKRTNDIAGAALGINQHGTRPGYTKDMVGTWSEGCLVGLEWARHLDFIRLLKTDPRYIVNPKFIFHTAIIAGDNFAGHFNNA